MVNQDFISRYRNSVTTIVENIETLWNIRKRIDIDKLTPEDFLLANSDINIDLFKKCLEFFSNISLDDVCYKMIR